MEGGRAALGPASPGCLEPRSQAREQVLKGQGAADHTPMSTWGEVRAENLPKILPPTRSPTGVLSWPGRQRALSCTWGS